MLSGVNMDQQILQVRQLCRAAKSAERDNRYLRLTGGAGASATVEDYQVPSPEAVGRTCNDPIAPISRFRLFPEQL